MATTKLWHIKGNIKDLIQYVENPEKTVPKTKEQQDFFNVFSYVKNPNKTQDGEYVTAINCLKEIALEQMIATKNQYGKDDKYIAWHGYRSFKPGEVSAEECHQIGIELAKEMWGDRFQIIVTTHLDKEHLHNHFAFNSVSYLDGGKYNYSKSEIQRLRETSDRLCRERGLSVIEQPRKAPSRPIWVDEKQGKPTKYNVMRWNIDEAISYCNSVSAFEKYLTRRGYEVDLSGVHWKIKLPQDKHFSRMDTLDERYTPEKIQAKISRTYHSFGTPTGKVNFVRYVPMEIQIAYKPRQKLQATSSIYRLYLYYCYQLGYLPKGTKYRPTSPYLKADLRKLDEITAQVDYMSKYKINTFDDLYADRESVEYELGTLTNYRTKLQNKIRRASPQDKEIYREEKAKVTKQIMELRKRLTVNKKIEVRSAKMQDNLDRAFENEEKAKQQQSNKRNTRSI